VRDFEIELVATYDEAINKLKTTFFDVLVTDLKLTKQTGLELINFAKSKNAVYGTILITGYSDEEAIIYANKIGVSEILKKPFTDEELLSAIDNILSKKEEEEEKHRVTEKLQKENLILKKELNKQLKDSLKIIGESPKLLNALKKAEEYAKYELNCLLGGESGTGKELLAKYIHMHGPRKNKPFVEVNCASISPSLFESEFFGYRKGAFTNANENHAGFFEIADGGILFLDEITEMPLEIQAKLLTAVERGLIHRVGDTKEIKIDVQIIAATNHDVEKIVETGKIRRDLYHRLSQGLIILPPLRERGADIKILMEYFKKKFESEFGKKSKAITDEFWEKIINYSWPGNVRQLSNFVKKWVLFGEETFYTDNTEKVFSDIEDKKRIKSVLTFDFVEGTIDELEKAKQLLIMRVLNKYNGNKSQAARHLGITYQGLLKMLKKINPEIVSNNNNN
jgi:DNA-binding NtrC family response regulator